MQSTSSTEEAQAGIKIAGRNINNLRYADDTTLMAESEEELKSLFFWYMKIYYYHAFIIKIYDLGLSFLPLYKAKRETLATLTTLKQTPGMSPTA